MAKAVPEIHVIEEPRRLQWRFARNACKAKPMRQEKRLNLSLTMNVKNFLIVFQSLKMRLRVLRHNAKISRRLQSGGKTTRRIRMNRLRKTGKLLAVSLIFLLGVSALAGCANTKNIDGTEYDTYGLFSKDEKKNPKIQYEIVWGNVIWGAVLCETIVAPIYFYGFSMWEPVGKKVETIGAVAK